MELSARNTYLNPTQHLWDNMEKRLRAMEGHPNHFSQLTRAVLDFWENIGQNHNRNLILNMPERYQAVINARGENTRFQEKTFKFRWFFRFLIFTRDVTFSNFCIFFTIMCFFVRKCVENISHGSAVIVVNIFFYVSKLAFLIKKIKVMR
jgi:hypothetical protein